MPKAPAQLEREIAAALSGDPALKSRCPSPARYQLTAERALALPRYEWIATWLVLVTRKKADRGPLGQHVTCTRGEYRVWSGGSSPTCVFRTRDPALLFDYARRTQLGGEIRRAEDFRTEAYLAAGR